MCDEEVVLKELKSISGMVADLIKDKKELNNLKAVVHRHDLLIDEYLNGVNIKDLRDDAEMLLETANELKQIIAENKRPDKWDKILFGLIIIVGAFSYYVGH